MESTNERKPEFNPDPRVRFAAERTLLAWIRTSLAMMGFGFVVARFGFFLRELAAMGPKQPRPNSGFSFWIGAALVVLGVLVTLLAALQHWRILRGLPPRETTPGMGGHLGLLAAVVLATIGIAMTGYLFTIADE